MREHFGAIRTCYEEGLRRNGDLAGEVATRFVIGIDGTVQTAQIECTTLPDDLVVDCVVQEVRSLTFPAPEGGAVTIVYPIVFNPAD